MNVLTSLLYRIPLRLWLARDGLHIGWKRRIGPYVELTNYTHWLTLLLHPAREWHYLRHAMPEAVLKDRF